MSGYYVVRQGDYLAKIARQHGFGDWHTIYDDANNASFRQLRPDPNLIEPGDRIFIPTRQMKISALPAGPPKQYRLRSEPTTLHVVIQDAAGQPAANAPYVLALPDREVKGTTDGSGAVLQTVPVDVERATLRVGDSTIPLLIGHLDPMPPSGNGGVAGVQGRLRNLGYEPGGIDGVMTDETRAAIRAFEARNSMPVTGEISPALKSKLRQLYGC